MSVNKTKMVGVLIIGLFFGACVIPGITGLDSSYMNSRKVIILVGIYDSNDISFLESVDARILETYDHDVLIEIDPLLLSQIEERGLSLISLPHRTMLFVGDMIFDGTMGEPDIPDELRVDEYDSDEYGLYIVHMIGPIAFGWRPALEKAGVKVLNYVHNFAYRVLMTPEQKADVLDLYFVDWVGVYHPYYKLQSDLKPGIVTIGMVPGVHPQSLATVRENVAVLSEGVVGDDEYLFIAEIPSTQTLHGLARINDVLYIAPYVEPELHDEMATQVIGGGLWFFDDDDGDPTTVYRLNGNFGSYMNQIGYTGDGVTIAVADTGIGSGTVGNAGHLDFTGRVIGGYSYQGGWEDGHSHGTHCSGSAAGDTYLGTGSTVYNNYYSGQGSAPKSNLFAVRIFNAGGSYIGPQDTYHMIQIAKQNSDAYVHTNSWGAAVSGSYDSSASRFDAAVRGETMVVTVSAGNYGPTYTRICSPGTGKNVITIGGSQPYNPPEGYSNPENMYSSSSRGWTRDNRVKPDVLAPAQRIYSTMPDGGYGYKSGTSMSNPAVAGAAAVTVQWYEDNHGCRPSPAMVKALLINTANEMGGNTEGPIPNRDEGWGMADISKLQRPLGDPVPFYLSDQQIIFTESGQTEEHLVMTDREDVPVKVSLVWTDKEAPSGTGSGRTLTNDLNLEVISPSGAVYRGNAFSGGWTQAGANAMSIFDYCGDGWDDTNNVENVYIHVDDVEIGFYTVRVKANLIAGDGVNVGYNSQDYALVVYNGLEDLPYEPPSKPSGPDTGTRNVPYCFTSSATEPEGEDIFFLFNWGDGTSSGWLGPYCSGSTVTASHSWDTLGEYEIKVRIRDVDNNQSGWSEPHTISIVENQPPEKPNKPSGTASGKVNVEYTYTTSTIDPDGEHVYYLWDWGDGTPGEWLGPCTSGATASTTHTWSKDGAYLIRVKAKDWLGAESEWSDPLPVTMPYSYNRPFMNFLLRLFERFPNAFPLLRQLLGL
jgi:hypothetical protein